MIAVGKLRSPMPSLEHWACGVRAKYVAGCRCEACTRANREYAHRRALAHVRGQDNPLVDAEPMRAHLFQLTTKGVGLRAVEAASDVSRTVLLDVKAGRKRRVRADTVRRVLAVDEAARADASFVDAGPTHEALREMLRMGWRKYEIAARLGNKAKHPALQLFKAQRVLASTARRVAKLLEVMREELRLEEEVGEVCAQCGHSHAPESRLRLLKAHEGVPSAELRRAHPFECFYAGDAGNQKLRRDRLALEGERDGREPAHRAVSTTTRKR